MLEWWSGGVVFWEGWDDGRDSRKAREGRKGGEGKWSDGMVGEALKAFGE